MTYRAPSFVAVLSALSALLPGCPGGEPAPTDAGTDAPADGGVPCADDPLQDACLPEEPTYTGPSATIRILRDASGVPHVYAATDEDAYFGSGYAQATDRLFEMDMTRRRALGRRAEVLGEGAFDDDRTIRVIDIPRWAELNRRQLLVEDDEQYVLLLAWVAGVNRRIAEIAAGTVPMPVGFAELDFTPEPWTPLEALAVGKMILFGNANLIDYEVLASVIRQYFPTLDASLPLLRPLQDTFVVPPGERPARAHTAVDPSTVLPLPGPDRPEALGPDFPARFSAFRARWHGAFGALGASNNWAVEGAHTASGRPILAGDPHQGLESPSLMWMHHMHSDETGGLDVNGFAFVGTPSIQLGHNRHVAWSATTTYPDWMDLWEVRHDRTAGTVRLGDRTLPISARIEAIQVRGEAAPRMVEIEEVRNALPGSDAVILPDDFFPIPLAGSGRSVLLSWTGFRPTHEAQGFHGFDVATSRDAFDAAADLNEVGAFNFVAIDRDGLTYRSSPRTPIRNAAVGTGNEAWVLRDGDDTSTLWNGEFLRPGMELPHSRGADRGWIASANNDPLGFMNDGRTTGDAYYFGVFFDPGTRAHRIESELTRLVARGDVTVSDMETLQDDTYAELAELLLPDLLAAWDGRATDTALETYRDRADLAELAERLRAWDRRMERTSSEAVVFNAFQHFLLRGVLADDLAVVFQPLLSGSATFTLKLLVLVLREGDPSFLDEGRSLLLVRALEETATWLTARFGGTTADRYVWGDYHVTCFSPLAGVAALDGGCTPTDGGIGTVNVSDSDFFDGDLMPRERTESHGGSIYRLVAEIDADGVPRARVNVPRGNSGDPESPYWDDLHADWTENVYRELLFDLEDVEASAMGPGGGGELELAP